MKKAFFLVMVSGLMAGAASGQKLLDIYKKGPVKLVAEKTYGARNNWESLFNLYYDTISTFELPRERDKKIVIAPDGSVFMSHKNRHEIWKFTPDGTFEKRFGEEGGKLSQFQMLPLIQPVVDGKYIFTSDVNGRLKFFDLDGNYFKSISLNYMLGGFQPLNNGEVLLEGHVMWNGENPGSKYVSYKWRHIIVNLNIYTGKEKIIYSVFENPVYKYPKTSNPDSIQSILINPSENKIYVPDRLVFSKPFFTLLNDGQILQFNRETGEVKMLDKGGKGKGNFKLGIEPLKLTEKDVEENFKSENRIHEKTIDEINKMKDSIPGHNQLLISHYEQAIGDLKRYKDVNNYYPYLPYFSNIILDDEGNLLIFEFTKLDETQSNIFNVIAYNEAGERLARTSFICDDYDLSFSESTFVISKGYVYAVAKLKNYKGMPLRLVKFKITN